MFDRIKTRLSSEEGFTLIELLVVIIILGILVAIAVPAYLSFTSSAHNAAAESNVRSAIPAAESYMEQSTTGTYQNMTPTALKSVAPGVKVSDVVVSADYAAYCIDATSGTTTAYYIGGDQVAGTSGFASDTGTNGTITTGSACSAVVSG